MIYEYALEPEMVAQWGSRENYRFFSREFKIGNGRLVSRYPKSWQRKVLDAFNGKTPMERKRLVELLASIKTVMVKRKNIYWDDTKISWVDNASCENKRYPFHAIIDRNNQEEIIPDIAPTENTNDRWNIRHGVAVKRSPEALCKYIYPMLSVCEWVKFIDPYLSPGRPKYVANLKLFFDILVADRPVKEPRLIEIHTRDKGQTKDFLQDKLEKIIPLGLEAVLYQWKQKTNCQKLHNRYILTDHGGISISHGLDAGGEGEIDDIFRLELEQYNLHCIHYNSKSLAFEYAEEPLRIIGKAKRR